MPLSREKQGETSVLFSTFLWGVFPVITVLSLGSLDPLLSLGVSTFFASIFFACFLTVKRKWRDLKNKNAFKDVLFASLLLGIGYYALYYLGLRSTSPGNAAIIALSEVFFSFILFHLWHKHYIPKTHIYGALLTLTGAVIILFPNFKEFQSGDFLILAAAFIAPLGNYFQQRARKSVSAEAILFVRTMIGFPIIFLLAYFFHSDFSGPDIKKVMPWLILNGFVILSLSKIFWIEGIHRMSVTKATALGAIAPLITLFFAWLILNESPTNFQLLSVIPMCAGVALLGIKGKQKIPALIDS
ncbi:MAG: DMT family transporter [Patescibacteria group bacterium]|jgi:drug/metabolite transporter (DMT)-like permease